MVWVCAACPKSARGLAHSKTLARMAVLLGCAEDLELRVPMTYRDR